MIEFSFFFRHVTNHRAGEEAQDELLSLNPMGLLLTVLHSYMSEQRKHWPSIKAITELIRHLSQRPMNQRILRDSTWVASIRDLTMFLVDGLMVSEHSITFSHVI